MSYPPGGSASTVAGGTFAALGVLCGPLALGLLELQSTPRSPAASIARPIRTAEFADEHGQTLEQSGASHLPSGEHAAHTLITVQIFDTA